MALAWAHYDSVLTATPVQVSAERYMEMLEVLPPARWAHDGFLVGEPHDHSGPEGHARYAYFYRRGDEHFEAGLLTEAQFNARHPRSKWTRSGQRA